MTVFSLADAASPALLDVCRTRMTSVLQRGGAIAQGWYVTEPGPNNFPRLPVREGEHVLVGVAVFKEMAAYEAFLEGGHWQRDVAPMLLQWLTGEPLVRQLVPTARSAIHA